MKATATLELKSNRKETAAAPNFSGLARWYRWMELLSFGPWLARCRFAFLPELGGCHSGLVLGDGDGRFSARLLEANSEIRVDAIDASDAMLRTLLRGAGPAAARVRAYCGDIRQWEPSQRRYDLIVSHFFLDCLTAHEVYELAGKVREVADSSAMWVVSDFAVPDGWAGRLAGLAVIGGLYRAFGLLTGLPVRALPAHAEALQSCGFRLERRKRFLGGLLFSEVWRVDPFVCP